MSLSVQTRGSAESLALRNSKLNVFMKDGVALDFSYGSGNVLKWEVFVGY
jgi:hypothetical protein